jgi:hypothetical protein
MKSKNKKVNRRKPRADASGAGLLLFKGGIKDGR